MRGLLVHVAVSLGDLGAVGPIFDGGTFEYLPPPGVCPPVGSAPCLTYADIPARNKKYGETLADFLPESLSDVPLHLDPDFDSHTYGEVYAAYGVDREGRVKEVRFRGPSYLRGLRKGDLLFFMADLAPYRGGEQRIGKYAIGFFTVEGVADVSMVKVPRDPGPVRGLLAFADPPLVPRESVSEGDLDKLVEWGYVEEGRDFYRLTWEGATTLLYASVLLHSENAASRWFASYLEGEAERVAGLREVPQEGAVVLVDVKAISGSVSLDDVESNYHYKQLFPIDINPNVVIVKGDARASALLDEAVQLTRRKTRGKFRLNKLGRQLLGREADKLRGSYWLGDGATRRLAEEVARKNPHLAPKLRNL